MIWLPCIFLLFLLKLEGNPVQVQEWRSKWNVNEQCCAHVHRIQLQDYYVRVLARTAHYALSLLQVLVALCRKHPALFEAEPSSCGEFRKYKINSGHLFKYNIFHVYECNCPDIQHNIVIIIMEHFHGFIRDILLRRCTWEETFCKPKWVRHTCTPLPK